MLFNSFQFFIFFAIVYFLYRVLPYKGQNFLLLIASLVFYGTWDWRFLFLMLGSALIDYYAGLKIASVEDRVHKRRYLVLSMISNLTILGFFKYFNFFSDSFKTFLQIFGLEANYTTLNIVLPVGISFYTFQSMSYAIDIYRGNLKPVRSMPDFILFVTFFPQLVAGPIERASNLLPQVLGERQITPEKNRDGVWLILWGLFKKVVIADNLANVVNTAFAQYASLSGPEVLAAVYAFAIQIYCDFSGYSDIARGLAKLLGFELMVNFNLPYLSKNPTEFWQQWHISLSTWLRDYLYIPLGGNRKGELMTYRNLMLTMVLGGLWHGAAWTFVIWGFYQGTLLVLHRLSAPTLGRWLGNGKAVKIISVMVNFQLTAIGWLIFRAESFGQLMDMASKLLFDWNAVGNAVTMFGTLLAYTWPLIFFQWQQAKADDFLPHYRWHSSLRLAWSGLLGYMIFVYGALDGQEFIYFQF